MQQISKAQCQCGTLMAVLGISSILLGLSFDVVDVNVMGLRFDSISQTIDTEAGTWQAGRHFVGLGSGLIKVPSTQRSVEWTNHAPFSGAAIRRGPLRGLSAEGLEFDLECNLYFQIQPDQLVDLILLVSPRNLGFAVTEEEEGEDSASGSTVVGVNKNLMQSIHHVVFDKAEHSILEAASLFNLDDLLKDRQRVQTAISTAVESSLAEMWVNATGFSFQYITLPEEVEAQIVEKMRIGQLVLWKQNEQEQRRVLAETKVVQGHAARRVQLIQKQANAAGKLLEGAAEQVGRWKLMQRETKAYQEVKWRLFLDCDGTNSDGIGCSDVETSVEGLRSQYATLLAQCEENCQKDCLDAACSAASSNETSAACSQCQEACGSNCVGISGTFRGNLCSSLEGSSDSRCALSLQVLPWEMPQESNYAFPQEDLDMCGCVEICGCNGAVWAPRAGTYSCQTTFNSTITKLTPPEQLWQETGRSDSWLVTANGTTSACECPMPSLTMLEDGVGWTCSSQDYPTTWSKLTLEDQVNSATTNELLQFLYTSKTIRHAETTRFVISDDPELKAVVSVTHPPCACNGDLEKYGAHAKCVGQKSATDPRGWCYIDQNYPYCNTIEDQPPNVNPDNDLLWAPCLNNSISSLKAFADTGGHTCYWRFYDEGTDWQFYSQNKITLERCASACLDKADCVAFEVPITKMYCSLWLGSHSCTGPKTAGWHPSTSANTWVLDV